VVQTELIGEFIVDIMDLTTIDDVLKQKKQELKNVKRLILNSHNYVAKLLHKKFVENNGCKVCHGTGRLYDHNANANNFSGSCSCLRCSCLQETREKSGVDPYNGFEKHVFYQENVFLCPKCDKEYKTPFCDKLKEAQNSINYILHR